MLEEDYLPVGEVSTFATEIEIKNDEIILKGDSVFGGYLENYRGGFFKENGKNCYRTGDLGFIKEGKLYCIGRKDQQIKWKGYRIELSDVEQNILKIQGIKECVVIPKYQNHIVKKLCAYLVVEDGITISYIQTQMSSFLPDYMIPKVIKIIDFIPMTKNGKLDRKRFINL